MLGGGAHLVIVADDLLALLAGVGVQAVVAGDAVRLVLHLDVLASAQGLVAVLAVEAVAHDGDFLLSPTSRGAEGGFTQAAARSWLSAGRKEEEEEERGRGGGKSEIRGTETGKQDEGRQTTRGKVHLQRRDTVYVLTSKKKTMLREWPSWYFLYIFVFSFLGC